MLPKALDVSAIQDTNLKSKGLLLELRKLPKLERHINVHAYYLSFEPF